MARNFILLILVIFLYACSPNQPASTPVVDPQIIAQPKAAQGGENMNADVISVNVSGSANAYQFSVEIASPDTGCEQYADWWEVLSEDGQLLYRRVLLHSHVNEQPFSRSGGPVVVGADTMVIVRAHMNNSGYGGRAMRGSAETGFEEIELPQNYAIGVESEPPLPDGCAF